MRSILVPLDGSPFAEHALGVAASIAQRAGAALHLVRMHQGVPAMAGEGAGTNWGSVDDSIREGERDYLVAVARRLRTRDALRVEHALTDGVGLEEIAEHAHRVGAELVVMATHARTGLARALMGSVADVVVRRGAVPVLLVRPGHGPPTSTVETRFRRMLVALDGSAYAERVLPVVADLAALVGATLELVRHVERVPQERYAGMRDMLEECAREATARQVEHARQYLVGIAIGLQADRIGLRVETRVLTDGDAPWAIVRAARASSAGLVALATHGRGASRLVVESVADVVLHDAPGDVLLLRPPADALTLDRVQGLAHPVEHEPA